MTCWRLCPSSECNRIAVSLLCWFGCAVAHTLATDDTCLCFLPALQGFPEKNGIFPSVRVKWVEGDPSSLEALNRAELHRAHAVVIGGSGDGPAKEADALTLTTITLAQVSFLPLQELLLQVKRDVRKPTQVAGRMPAPRIIPLSTSLSIASPLLHCRLQELLFSSREGMAGILLMWRACVTTPAKPHTWL